MADDPKAGAAAVAGETASEGAQVGTTTEQARDAAAAETAEQKAARLEQELDNERKKQGGWQAKVEEANRIIAERSAQPPPSTSAADPLDQELQAAAEALQQYPNDPGYRAAYRLAHAEKQRAEAGRLWAKVQPEFAALPEKYRARAQQIWIASQGAISVATAHAAAMGETVPEIDKTREQLDKERKEIDADRAARDSGRVALGTRPLLGPEKLATPGVKNVKQSEWDAMMDDSVPYETRRAYNSAYNSGQINIVPG
jgi:hypothetical protein